MTPSWRKPAGALLMVAGISLWAIVIVSLSSIIGGWPILAQTGFYALTGIIWIMPMKPLLRWMETGRWRP